MTSARRPPAVDLALVAVFAALIAVLGLPGAVPLPFTPVPITLQTLAVMLTGTLLGWRRGGLAVLLFMALVAAGLPLLAGGRGGIGAFAAPSAGFLIGWFFGVLVIGFLVQRRLPHYPMWWGAVANLVGGVAVVYLVGIPVQAFLTGISLTEATLASLAFVPGDLVKVAVATVVGAGVLRALPDLAPAPTARERVRDRLAS